MGTYDRPIATALRIIKEKGQIVSWRKPLSESEQPWNPVALGELTYSPQIAFLPINREDFATYGYMNASDIPQGAVRGLMGQVAFAPKLKDYVIRDGLRHNLDKFDVVNINGEIILYKLVFLT